MMNQNRAGKLYTEQRNGGRLDGTKVVLKTSWGVPIKPAHNKINPPFIGPASISPASREPRPITQPCRRRPNPNISHTIFPIMGSNHT